MFTGTVGLINKDNLLRAISRNWHLAFPVQSATVIFKGLASTRHLCERNLSHASSEMHTVVM